MSCDTGNAIDRILEEKAANLNYQFVPLLHRKSVHEDA
jgi:hypothetical protein